MMNREQRRKYAKSIKNFKGASICPECGNRARFYSTARGEKDTVLKCEVCNAIVREGEELTKAVVPGVYIPFPLETLDKVLIQIALHSDNEEKKEESTE